MVPPNKGFPLDIDTSDYILVWDGKKYGGKLYIAVNRNDPYLVYFALHDVPTEDPLIGSIQIVADTTPEQQFERIAKAIEAGYAQQSYRDMKMLLETEQVRIQ